MDEKYFCLFEFDSSFLLVDDQFVDKLKAFKKDQFYYLTGNICQFEGKFLPILTPKFVNEVKGLNKHHYLRIVKEIQLKYYRDVFPFDFFENYYFCEWLLLLG